jgi:ribosomal protein S6
MKYYELSLICPPEFSEEELNQFKEKAVSALQEKGGILNELKNPVKKIFGSPIKKKKSGFLFVFNFSALPEQLKEIEKEFKAMKEIIRYLILVKNSSSIKEEPQRISPRIKKLETHKEPKVGFREIEKKLDEILGE